VAATDVNEGTIRVAQQKTGRKLTIPLHRDLLTVLTAAKRDRGSRTPQIFKTPRPGTFAMGQRA